jgi:hypothetical protein
MFFYLKIHRIKAIDPPSGGDPVTQDGSGLARGSFQALAELELPTPKSHSLKVQSYA